MTRKTLDDKQVARAKAALESSAQPKQVAARFGVSVMWLYHHGLGNLYHTKTAARPKPKKKPRIPWSIHAGN